MGSVIKGVMPYNTYVHYCPFSGCVYITDGGQQIYLDRKRFREVARIAEEYFNADPEETHA